MKLAILLFPIFVLLTLVIQRWYKRLVQRRTLPPGPRGWPLIGNIPDIPADYSWIGYTEMAKKYGDIIYLEAIGQPLLVLSSLHRAIDLLDKRSANYSDRPWSRMLHEMMGWKFGTALIPYGDAWRRRRKMLHSFFNQKAVDILRPVQERSTSTLVHNILHDPVNLSKHISFHTGSIILKVTFDYDSQPKDDPLIELEDTALMNFNEATKGGSYLVDFFPLLQYLPTWFPGSGFLSVASQGKQFTTRMQTEPFEYARMKMNEKTSSCFTAQLLSELEDDDEPHPDSEQAIKDVVAFTYAAGADSSAAALSTFILAMVHFPDVQKKAQEMLDAVVSHDRLPTFEDKPDLPYIQCIVQETLRWNPVTPLGVAHQSVEDDLYDGYRIPAGTIVTPNIWAMLHNQTDYPNPEVFDPDRFVNEDGKILPPDPVNIAFGFGRRICPGRYFALNTLWITIASILSVFTIAKDIDENGKELTPEIAYVSGLAVRPKPFTCRLIPRSEKQRASILASGQ